MLVILGFVVFSKERVQSRLIHQLFSGGLTSDQEGGQNGAASRAYLIETGSSTKSPAGTLRCRLETNILLGSAMPFLFGCGYAALCLFVYEYPETEKGSRSQLVSNGYKRNEAGELHIYSDRVDSAG